MVNEFWHGRKSVEDDYRSGRPSDAVNLSVIADCGETDQKWQEKKVLEIARTMQISCGSMETIVHDHLKMSKVSARWVLRNTIMMIVRDASLHFRRSQMPLSLALSSLCGSLLLGAKRGFATGNWRANPSRCSGNMPHLLLQGSSELYHLLGNSWQPFSGTVKDYCLPRLQGSVLRQSTAWRNQGEMMRNADARSLAHGSHSIWKMNFPDFFLTISGILPGPSETHAKLFCDISDKQQQYNVIFVGSSSAWTYPNMQQWNMHWKM